MRFLGALSALLLSFSARAMVDGIQVDATDPISKSVVFIAFGDMNRCTGALVGKRLVLSANHCMEARPETYKIVFATDISAALEGKIKPQVRRVIKAIAAPTFAKKDPLSDDAVLLVLEEDAPESATIAALPDGVLSLAPGTRVTSYGYGLQNAQGIPLPWERINLVKKSFSISAPEHPYSFGIYLDHHRLFVSQHQGGICMGDSGGPVFLERKSQAPLLVAVNGAALSNFPDEFKQGEDICAANSYFTRVDTLADWIQSVIKDQTLSN